MIVNGNLKAAINPFTMDYGPVTTMSRAWYESPVRFPFIFNKKKLPYIFTRINVKRKRILLS